MGQVGASRGLVGGEDDDAHAFIPWSLRRCLPITGGMEKRVPTF